jgi:hypothetical protein
MISWVNPQPVPSIALQLDPDNRPGFHHGKQVWQEQTMSMNVPMLSLMQYHIIFIL